MHTKSRLKTTRDRFDLEPQPGLARIQHAPTPRAVRVLDNRGGIDEAARLVHQQRHAAATVSHGREAMQQRDSHFVVAVYIVLS